MCGAVRSRSRSGELTDLKTEVVYKRKARMCACRRGEYECE